MRYISPFQSYDHLNMLLGDSICPIRILRIKKPLFLRKIADEHSNKYSVIAIFQIIVHIFTLSCTLIADVIIGSVVYPFFT